MTLSRVRTRPVDLGELGDPAALEAPAAGPAVHVVTFGCQMNKYDSLLVEGRFVAGGYRLTERPEEADVLLFNTCSVREHAEERVWSWLGELKRAKETRPELVIGVLGCMAQRVEDAIFARAGHVDVVCGTREIHRLPELVDEVRARRSAPDRSGNRAARLLATDMASEVRVDRRAEAYAGGLCGYLAVMRGCDLNCTFCIVPTVRGRVQSRPIEELVLEARWMVAGGARVITLLGQTVDAYGEDLPPRPGARRGTGRRGRPSLADLLRALQELEGLERLRLITLHPSYVTAELALAVRDCTKVDRFLPLPAQSGSDDVLRRMKRGYTTDLYRRRVELLREAVPDLELGSDWIVGFPGESEADYARTEAFLEEIGFAQSYVFKYDPRPGTKAFELADDVSPAVKKERNNRLLACAERVALGRMRRWIGASTQAFLEEPARHPGFLKGRTLHNLPVSVPGEEAEIGTLLGVTIAEATAFGLGAARNAS